MLVRLTELRALSEESIAIAIEAIGRHQEQTVDVDWLNFIQGCFIFIYSFLYLY